jgi:cell division protein FtsI (penicillin-binding protein 3)
MLDGPREGNAYTGGEVAAPVFSKVVQQTLRTLGVEHDQEVRSTIRTRPDGVAQGTP